MPSMRQSYTVTVPEEPPAAAFPFLKQEMRRKGSMSGSALVSTFVGLIINQAKVRDWGGGALTWAPAPGVSAAWSTGVSAPLRVCELLFGKFVCADFLAVSVLGCQARSVFVSAAVRVRCHGWGQSGCVAGAARGCAGLHRRVTLT